MPGVYHDPITNRLQPYRRVDLTAPAYLQRTAPNALVEELAERLASLERRGA